MTRLKLAELTSGRHRRGRDERAHLTLAFRGVVEEGDGTRCAETDRIVRSGYWFTEQAAGRFSSEKAAANAVRCGELSG